jgi:hypothetical protein
MDGDGLAGLDSNFKYLAESLVARSPPPPNNVVTVMTSFRKTLSFSWLSQIPHSSRVTQLASAIRVLLLFTENSDPTIRVTPMDDGNVSSEKRIRDQMPHINHDSCRKPILPRIFVPTSNNDAK